MRDLRLTHGGFYRHFDSKEALFAEAFAVGLEQVSERLVQAVEAAPRGGELRALIDAYLSQSTATMPRMGVRWPLSWPKWRAVQAPRAEHSNKP